MASKFGSTNQDRYNISLTRGYQSLCTLSAPPMAVALTICSFFSSFIISDRSRCPSYTLHKRTVHINCTWYKSSENWHMMRYVNAHSSSNNGQFEIPNTHGMLISNRQDKFSAWMKYKSICYTVFPP